MADIANGAKHLVLSSRRSPTPVDFSTVVAVEINDNHPDETVGYSVIVGETEHDTYRIPIEAIAVWNAFLHQRALLGGSIGPPPQLD